MIKNMNMVHDDEHEHGYDKKHEHGP